MEESTTWPAGAREFLGACRAPAAHVREAARRDFFAPPRDDESFRFLLIHVAGEGGARLRLCYSVDPGRYRGSWADERRPRTLGSWGEREFPSAEACWDDAAAWLTGDLAGVELVCSRTTFKHRYLSTVPETVDDFEAACREAVGDFAGPGDLELASHGVAVTVRREAGTETAVHVSEALGDAVVRRMAPLWVPGCRLRVVQRPFDDVRNHWTNDPAFEAARRRLEFWEASLEEFVAETWHPSRVVDWCLPEDERRELAAGFETARSGRVEDPRTGGVWLGFEIVSHSDCLNPLSHQNPFLDYTPARA